MDKLECPICRKDKAKFKCMVLTNCRHVVCRACLRTSFTYCGTSGFRCPVDDCDEWLQDAELKDILENTRLCIEPIPVANHWNWSERLREEKTREKVPRNVKKEPEISSYLSKVPVANHRSWSERLREEKTREKAPPKVEKEAEIPSYLSKKDFPELPSSSAKDSEDSRLTKVRNVMDEPVPIGSKSYDSFKSSRKESLERNQKKFKGWDSENRTRLRKLIHEKMHKIVDFVCIASESDLTQNIGPVVCLICQNTIRPYEGVTFPYCSSYFCLICVTQPEKHVEDVILMYSDSSDENKNCAVIIQGEMRRTLLDKSKPGTVQESFAQKNTIVPRNSVNSLVSIYENECKKDSYDFSHNIENCTSSNASNDRASKQDFTPDNVLFRNMSPTSCEFCYTQIEFKKGVILRGCFHVLCERCLVETIMDTLKTGVEVHCPMLLDNYQRCKTIIQEREIKCLLSGKQYKLYEEKCLEAVVDGFESSIHCLKPNCTGWVVIEGYKDSFKCPVCASVNCLSCKAIHQGKPCSTYQMELKRSDDKDKSLKAKLMALDSKQKTRCPKCHGTNLKPPRCNFIRCIDCENVFCQPTPESKL